MPGSSTDVRTDDGPTNPQDVNEDDAIDERTAPATGIRVPYPVRRRADKRRGTEPNPDSPTARPEKVQRGGDDTSDDEPNIPGHYVPDVDSSEQGSTDMDDDDGELALHDSNDILDADDRRVIYAAVMSVDVTELYPPERVAEVCRKFRLTPGCAFALTDEGRTYMEKA